MIGADEDQPTVEVYRSWKNLANDKFSPTKHHRLPQLNRRILIETTSSNDLLALPQFPVVRKARR
jgi:hypothetical protein